MSKQHLRPTKKPTKEPPKPILKPEDVDLWSFWDRTFELPWRTVEAPVWACATLALQADKTVRNDLGLLFDWLALSTAQGAPVEGWYWDLEDAAQLARSHRSPGAVAVQSGLRCIQLHSAKSDGGGMLYNVPLQRAVSFAAYRGILDEGAIDDVLCNARAKDASDDIQIRSIVRGRYQRRLITGLYP